MKRLITGGKLNSPWGLAKVPQQFGTFDSEVLLVSNFGDGHINAYNVNSGAFIGTLSRSLELPAASTLSDNLNAVSNQTRSLIHQAHGTHAFGFRLRANAPEGQKRFPISCSKNPRQRIRCVFQLLYRFHHLPPGLFRYMPISIDYTRNDTFDVL